MKTILLSLLLFSSTLLAEEHYRTPIELPNVDRSMTTAGFWISHHPSPDATIMTPQAIETFHHRNQQKGLKNIFNIIPSFNKNALSNELQQTLQSMIAQRLCITPGVQADASWFSNLREIMDLPNVGITQKPCYGMVIHYTDQRVLPTYEGLYSASDTSYMFGYFDLLQNSSFDVGTPVVILHTSSDRQWYYVQTEFSDGWMSSNDIARGTEEQIKTFTENTSPAVVITPHADLYLNQEKTDYYDSIRMGTHLPLLDTTANEVNVMIPLAEDDGSLSCSIATMNSEEVHSGFLPYTARSIYEQAFAMLNQPYGWGGSFGQQDCSQFLQMVFGTVGITLPRNSASQAYSDTTLVTFPATASDTERLSLFQNLPAGQTLLHLPGHIMLYLGTVNGIPYAMHDTTRFPSEDETGISINFLNRVVVSDLSLGATFNHLTYLQRLSDAAGIQ